MVASVAVVLVLQGAPAHAGGVHVRDAADDTSGRGLDIIQVAVRNDDHGVTLRVRFAKLVRGEVIASVDPRGTTGVRVVSEYRPKTRPKSYVLKGAFTDRADTSSTAQQCDGLRVRWSRSNSSVRIRVPSACISEADYGDIRVSLLTERGSSDVDQAPETKQGELGTSRWIPRG